MHKGVVSKTETKYIATGWISYINNTGYSQEMVTGLNYDLSTLEYLYINQISYSTLMIRRVY